MECWTKKRLRSHGDFLKTSSNSKITSGLISPIIKCLHMQVYHTCYSMCCANFSGPPFKVASASLGACQYLRRRTSTVLVIMITAPRLSEAMSRRCRRLTTVTRERFQQGKSWWKQSRRGARSRARYGKYYPLLLVSVLKRQNFSHIFEFIYQIDIA